MFKRLGYGANAGPTVARVVGKLTTINSQSIRVYARDESNNVVECSGTVTITAGGSGYAKGCVYRKTDAATGVASRYENIGTTTSCNFNLIGAISAGEITLADGDILVGNGSGVAAAVTASGDVTNDNTGAFTIANDAVNEAKTADSDGTGGLYIEKFALAVYDFSVDGGTEGVIALTDTATLPDNAVVTAVEYDVLTTLTSATDAATVKLNIPTDGDLTTAIAISDASNPWDAGVQSAHEGGGAFGTAPTTVKTTAARALQIETAGGEDLTAGKVVFKVRYWVSE